MRSVGVRELKEQASKILRHVRDRREIIAVTHRGQVIAHLVPVEVPVERPLSAAEKEKLEAVLADMDQLAEEISRSWPPGVSAVDAIREQRREL